MGDLNKQKKKISIAWLEPEEECYKMCIPRGFLKSSLIFQNSIRLFTLIKKDKSKNYFKNDIYPIELINNPYQIKTIVDSDIVFVDSYRLGDKLICYLRQIDTKKNKKTICLQHGRYLDGYTRTLNKHLRKKAITYFKIILFSFFHYPLATSYFLLGGRKCEFSFGLLYNPIDYWKNFISKRGATFLSAIEIKDRDFERFKIKETKTKCVLYCAQSIVEDGRASLKKLVGFGKELKEFCKDFDYKLIIRPHPRSNIEMLKNIFPMASFENNDLITRPHIYFSHHSAITTLFIKNQVPCILYRINKEPIPKGIESNNFLMVTSKLTKNNYAKVQSFLKNDSNNHEYLEADSEKSVNQHIQYFIDSSINK